MTSFLSKILSLIIALASLLSFGGSVTNRALMVDQDGNVNIPEVLVTTAQLTSNEVAIIAAEAAALQAAKAAREGTNLVNATIASIMANEFIVYRYGYTDSLGVMVVLPPDTLCRVIDINATPLAATEDKIQLSLKYATTEDADQVEPALKYSGDVTKDLTITDANIVKTKASGSWTDEAGTVYPYVYSITFWVPKASAGFFCVYLDADAQDGDGMTFNIVGGITGGATSVVTNGVQILNFVGGILTGVKNVED